MAMAAPLAAEGAAAAGTGHRTALRRAQRKRYKEAIRSKLEKGLQ